MGAALPTIQKIARLAVDSDLLHEVVHGGVTETVATEGGAIPTAANAVNTLKAYNIRGAWVSGMTLAMKDVFISGGIAYVVLTPTPYVSTSVASDIAAGLIGVHQGATAEDLANSAPGKGAAMIGYLPAGIGAVATTVQEVLRQRVSIRGFGALGGGHDDTVAFNVAVAVINTIATAQGSTYPLPAIELPGDRYLLTDTIQIYPWVRFVSRGSVVLDFSSLASSKNGIVCRNPGTLAEGTFKSGTISPFLDGSNGDILILGPGQATSTGSAIVMGNLTTGTGNVRDTGGRGLGVSGWNAAVEWDPINLYLIGFDRCRFESNNYAVMVSQIGAGQINSGERMSFTNCTFGNTAQAVLNHNCDSIDINFINCSFDYFTDLVRCGPNSRYWAGRFTGCHIEAFDGYLANATTCGQYSHVTFDGCVVFPDAWVGASIASPSKLLFVGNPASKTYLQLTIHGLELRYTQPGYAGNSQLIQDAKIYECAVTDQRGFLGCVSRGFTLNRDALFTTDPAGTGITALNAWTFTPPGSGTTSGLTVAGYNGGNALKLASTNNSNLGGFTIMHKDHLQVRAGEIFNVGLDFYFPTATTFGSSLQVRAVLQFYDSAGVAINAFTPGFAQDLIALYANSALPNFSLGRERWLPVNSVDAVAPAGAASVTVGATGFGWSGDLYINNVAIQRGTV